MARDIFTVVLEQQWMIRFRGRHSPRYASQGEAVTAAADAAYEAGMVNPVGAHVRVQDSKDVFRTECTYRVDPPPSRRSPLRDLQDAVPDEGDHQSGYHGAAENDKAEKAPTHGIVPTMLSLRVKPSSSMSQCCPASRRFNRDAPNHAPLSGMGQSADLLPQKQITRPPVDA